MHGRSVVLLALLVSALPAGGQALRLTTHDKDNVGPEVVLPTRDAVWYLLSTGFEFCQDQELVMRATTLGGSFIGPDYPTDCAANSNGRSFAVQWPATPLVVNQVPPDFALHGWVLDPVGGRQTAEVIIGARNRSLGGTPTVLAHPNGTFIVVWGGKIDVAHFSIFGRVVNQDGTFATGEIRLPEAPANVTQVGGWAALLGNGDVIVIWKDQGTNPSWRKVDGRLFSPSLSPLGTDFPVLSSKPDPAWVFLAAAGDEYTVGWSGAVAKPDSIIQRFNRYTGPVSPEIAVDELNGNATLIRDLAMDAAGNTIVSWYDLDAGHNYISRFDPGMNRREPSFRIDLPPSDGDRFILGVRPNGDFVAATASPIAHYNWSAALSRRYFFPVSLLVAPGPGPANPPRVQAVKPDGSGGDQPFTPYGVSGYGANVAAGDIDGDQVAEALTGPGPGPIFGPQVRGFEGSGPPISRVNFYAYGTLRYGVRPGAGDIDQDGFSEILTAPGPGDVFGPHVRAFNYDGTTVRPIPGVSFFAYGTPRFGARVAAGDIDGDGFREILTAPGPGAIFRPHVRGFRFARGSVSAMGKVSFFARGGSYGASVSAADIESDGDGMYGDGFQEILAGAGPDPGWSGELSVYDYDGVRISQKLTKTAYQTSYGCVVAGGDIDQGDTEEVVAAPGPDPAAVPHVRAYEWTPNIASDTAGPYFDLLAPDDIDLFPGLAYGANVAVGSF